MSKSLGNVIDPLHVIQGVDLETLKESVRIGNLAPSEVDKSIKNLEIEYPDGIPSCGADPYALHLFRTRNKHAKSTWT
jgi:valyl-tRNA synthetase